MAPLIWSHLTTMVTSVNTKLVMRTTNFLAFNAKLQILHLVGLPFRLFR